MPGTNTGHHVAQAEQELQRCCAQLLARFGSELARHPLQVRINGLGSFGDRRQDTEPQVVRVHTSELTGSKSEVLASLLHAMVHWVNGLRGIKDCCHRGYHSRKFRDLAQEVGFEVGERVHRFGWCIRASPAGQRASGCGGPQPPVRQSEAEPAG